MSLPSELSQPLLRLARTTLGELASRDLASVRADQPLVQALTVLREQRVSGLIVRDERGRAVGVLSQSDLLRAGLDGTVADAMTGLVIAMREGTLVTSAARLMAESRIHRVLVEDEAGNAVGVVTTTDITRLVGEAGSLLTGAEVRAVRRQPDTRSPRSVFLASLARVRAAPTFGDAFYERLMKASPDIRAKFAQVDLDAQKDKLMGAFELAASVVEGKPAALRSLREQARIHDREHRNVPPSLYATWLTVLVQTVEAHDPAFDLQVEVSWRLVMGHVADYMARRY